MTGAWYEAKLFVEHATRIEHGTLHLIVGFLGWIAFALLLRRPLTSWLPWSAILIVIGWNEAVDLMIERWPHPGMQYGEGAIDLILTMVVPTVVLLLARYFPPLFQPPVARAKASPGETGSRRPDLDQDEADPPAS